MHRTVRPACLGAAGYQQGAPWNAPGACTTSDVTESTGRRPVPTVDLHLPKAHTVPLLHASRRDSFCRALFGLQLSRAVRLLGSRLQNRKTSNTTFTRASSAGPLHRLWDVRDLPFSLMPGCGPTPSIQLPRHASPSNLGGGDAAMWPSLAKQPGPGTPRQTSTSHVPDRRSWLRHKAQEPGIAQSS